MKKGCLIAVVVGLAVIAVIAGLVMWGVHIANAPPDALTTTVAVVLTGLWWNIPGPDANTDANVVLPCISVIVTDEMSGLPVCDAVIIADYTYRKLNMDNDFFITEYKKVVSLTDSHGIAMLDLPPIVEKASQDTVFEKIVLRVMHPQYVEGEDSRGFGTQSIYRQAELQSLAGPVHFYMRAVEQFPVMPEALRRNESVCTLLGRAVAKLPEYVEIMPRFGRTVDMEQYIKLYRATLERACDTAYVNIAARDSRVGLGNSVVPPEQIIYKIEEVSPEQIKHQIEEVSRQLGVTARPVEQNQSSDTKDNFAPQRAQTAAQR